MQKLFHSIYKIKISIHNILVSIQLYIKSSYKMKLIIVESPEMTSAKTVGRPRQCRKTLYAIIHSIN